MTIPAYIYARYSSLEQGKGHSLKRQLENARKRIHQAKWEYAGLDIKEPDFSKGLPERDYIDEGKSAFSGANRQPGGQLYEFERKAKLGHFRNGAVLVVENLDRLSRQGWEEAIAVLNNLTSNGVSVATVHDNKLFERDQRIELEEIMMIILQAELAFKESDKKSKRLIDSWAARIKAIQNGDKKALSKLPPRWIDVNPKTKEMSVNPHRGVVLNEIFEWYVSGFGLPKIAHMLNTRGERSWAFGKKDNGQGWNTAYLHKLLTNRAVLGEFEPMSRPHSGSKETTKGIRVPDYYPLAITADLFQRAIAHRATRQRIGGAQTSKLNNIFAGIVHCAHCNAPMYLASQQKAGRLTNHKLKDGTTSSYVAKVDRSYLQCNNRRRGNLVNVGQGKMGQCPNAGKPRYEHLEQAVLDTVLGLAMDNVSFSMPDRVADMEVQLAEHERQTQGKEFKLSNLQQAIAERFSAGLANMAGELEDEIAADIAAQNAMRDDLEREKGTASPEQHLQRVQEVRASLDSEDAETRYEARLRVMTAIKQVMSLRCDSGGYTIVTLVNGIINWKFDKNGDQIGQPVDIRHRQDLHRGLVRGELSGSAEAVAALLRRSV
jgi:DNA invertase Pin-like site-specific DNA recombinase